MATPSQKIAESLEILRSFQDENGKAVIKAKDISRTHKDRLLANGFIQEIMKGWYIASRPEDIKGDTTSWYTTFWHFAKIYLNTRFMDNWCLSPEQSLLIHAGNFTVPMQLLVRSPKARNNKTNLIFDTSIFEIRISTPGKSEITTIDGLNVYSLESGLVAIGQDFFRTHSTDARTCLAKVGDGSGILGKLLDGGHSVIAGRLAGAFRNIKKDMIAENIVKTMKSAGYNVREEDPFDNKLPLILNSRPLSPYVNRIKIMWAEMRQTIIDVFPKSKGMPKNIGKYLEQVEDNYTEDAYHSLSIEGYRVTPKLIEKVKSGEWNPDTNNEDNEQKNALAARGYYLAFQEVKNSIDSILNGESPSQVVDRDHSTWYRELFTPSIVAGILKASDLAGYRNGPVYIKSSKYIPPNYEAARDTMPVFFDLIKEETEPSVRVVLGHFIFVYIHPYFDGNGRIARFLMNAMLASGGYPWTVIPIEKRDEYMNALEKASIKKDIRDFAVFIGNLVRENKLG